MLTKTDIVKVLTSDEFSALLTKVYADETLSTVWKYYDTFEGLVEEKLRNLIMEVCPDWGLRTQTVTYYEVPLERPLSQILEEVARSYGGCCSYVAEINYVRNVVKIAVVS